MSLAGLVYDQIKDRPNVIPIEVFEKATERFSFVPIEICGELAGAIMIDGAEMHVAIKHGFRGKWFSKSIIRIMQDVMSAHGKITTSVAQDHEIGHWFAKRLGFIETHSKDGITYYEARHETLLKP